MPPWCGMDIMPLVLVGLLALIVGGVGVAVSHRPVTRRGLPLPQDAPRTCDECAGNTSRLLQLEGELSNVRAAVAEGISHVDRVEMRIQGAVKRARKELRESGAEHPGLEAEAAELSLIHGGGGEGPAMPVVPQAVEQPGSSVPGVSPEQLRRVRGI